MSLMFYYITKVQVYNKGYNECSNDSGLVSIFYIEKQFLLFTLDLPTSGLNFQFKARSNSILADSPVTSENGSTSGISGTGSNASSTGSDTTLVNAEETYTSSLFQTEPLYQFYDVGGGVHNAKVRFSKLILHGGMFVLRKIFNIFVCVYVYMFVRFTSRKQPTLFTASDNFFAFCPCI